MTPPVLPLLLPGFLGPTLPAWLRDRLRAGLGGVCLFAPNVESPAQLRGLTSAIRDANPYAVIAVDEEGGDVTRLFADRGSPFPGNAVLGRMDDLDATWDTATAVGWALRDAGCTVDFAPCVDVNSRSDNPVIGVRSFGDDAARVARHGAAWVAGLQATGVAATAKHFPGHGDTAQDSHVALPVVDRSLAELRQRELLPFAAAVGAGVGLVMTSHVLLPQVDPDAPATMSRTVLQDLLRDELAFGGVIVSDALDMAGASGMTGLAVAAVRSLWAGCDLLCLGTANTDAEITEIEAAVGVAVADGTLRPDRLQEAGERVRSLSNRPLSQSTGGQPSQPRPADGRDAGAPGPVSEAAVLTSFDVQPSAGRWRERAGTSGRYTLVRLDSAANMAVGGVPWGPFTDVAADVVVTPDEVATVPAEPGPLVVVGRDIHRHAFARHAVDRLRHEHDSVLVVDMGWPSDDRRYADVATFGASRLVGRALLGWLTGAVAASGH